MNSKWSRRVAPKPPINPLKIKLLFASVFGRLGRRPRQGQTLIFDDHLNENEGFLGRSSEASGPGSGMGPKGAHGQSAIEKSKNVFSIFRFIFRCQKH